MEMKIQEKGFVGFTQNYIMVETEDERIGR